jgi:hypothetical protein
VVFITIETRLLRPDVASNDKFVAWFHCRYD